MLFGSANIQNIIIEKAREIGNSIDGKIVFGAMVGSISQGVHTVDSDYDTRFLYIRDDFPDNILNPNKCREEDIVTRYYPEEELFYDKIPLWELTSFLQFIKTPSIEGNFSIGLHHLTAWTFFSPYVWDPFGLASRLAPMLRKACNLQLELRYHLSKIDEFFERNDEILIKDYLYSVIAAASIYYIRKEYTFAPIHIDSLMGMETCGDIRKLVYGLIERMRKESADYVNHSEHFVWKGTHFKIKTEHNQQLDKYIVEAYQMGEKMLIDIENAEPDIISDEFLDSIYMIIQCAMKERIVKGLW